MPAMRNHDLFQPSPARHHVDAAFVCIPSDFSPGGQHVQLLVATSMVPSDF